MDLRPTSDEFMMRHHAERMNANGGPGGGGGSGAGCLVAIVLVGAFTVKDLLREDPAHADTTPQPVHEAPAPRYARLPSPPTPGDRVWYRLESASDGAGTMRTGTVTGRELTAPADHPDQRFRVESETGTATWKRLDELFEALPEGR